MAQTEHGYLFFSDNPLGQEGLRSMPERLSIIISIRIRVSF
ncbi:MAG: hypothetical protein ACLR8Y_10665 [Alistipes indistinctus]